LSAYLANPGVLVRSGWPLLPQFLFSLVKPSLDLKISVSQVVFAVAMQQQAIPSCLRPPHNAFQAGADEGMVFD